MSLRCLICGGSRLDPQAYKCDRCGAAIGLRDEPCDVSEETENKLLEHAEELSKFGIKVEQHEGLRKDAATAIAIAALVIACGDSFDHGVLRKLVLYLKDGLGLPEEQILKLRLDEPEQILTYCRMDKKQELAGARTPYGMRAPLFRAVPQKGTKAHAAPKMSSKGGFASGRKNTRKKNTQKQGKKRT
jgi:hypothetical protein